MPDEWYSQGLKFECTCCGACCTGAPGYVLFTDEEAKGIARKLGISRDEFIRDFTHDTEEGRSINEVKTVHGYDCVFLDRTSLPGKAVCSLYEARPTQCRTFPFWPEHIRSRGAWESLGRSCEGVNRGPAVPLAEIRVQVTIQRADRAARE
jgi:uncharacterized protein